MYFQILLPSKFCILLGNILWFIKKNPEQPTAQKKKDMFSRFMLCNYIFAGIWDSFQMAKLWC